LRISEQFPCTWARSLGTFVRKSGHTRGRKILPTTEQATHLPRISIPSFSARSLVVRMQMAAPSPTPLAFPAVVEASPQFGNTGLREDSDSAVTPGRIVSSTETTAPLSSMGMISSAKIPLACD
jgi:hypothetical protein